MNLIVRTVVESPLGGGGAMGALFVFLTVVSAGVSLMAIVAFFSMAINVSKIRNEMELLRDVIEVQYRESQRAITQPGAGGEPTARRF